MVLNTKFFFLEFTSALKAFYFKHLQIKIRNVKSNVGEPENERINFQEFSFKTHKADNSGIFVENYHII